MIQLIYVLLMVLIGVIWSKRKVFWCLWLYYMIEGASVPLSPAHEHQLVIHGAYAPGEVCYYIEDRYGNLFSSDVDRLVCRGTIYFPGTSLNEPDDPPRPVYDM